MSRAPLRLAMIGGGPGSFIGPVHRMGALLDRRFDLVAGVFGRQPALGRERAREWGVAEDRAYATYADLLLAESRRPDGIEALAITTPNHTHYEIAMAAARAGIPIISDKPMTATLRDAIALAAQVQAHAVPFALTYTYAGYPMVREARARVADGAIGRVRKIVVEYAQGWLAERIEKDDKQAGWRTDPAQAGHGGCSGDIGVHAFHLAEYVSGLEVEMLCADLSTVVEGRSLDDDCNILLRFTGDVPGLLCASQISTGERNGVRIRIYGETGGLDWRHDRANELKLLRSDGSMETLYAGGPGFSARTQRATRLPAGHPEGFIEAFANLYADFADAIHGDDTIIENSLPGAQTGLRSLYFVDAAIRSSASRSWQPLLGDHQ